jgi:hypothetical protein
MDESNNRTIAFLLGSLVVVVVLLCLAYRHEHPSTTPLTTASSKKDSYASYYVPQGVPQGEGPMQNHSYHNPHGTHMSGYSMPDHTGAGCGCSSSLHEMASAHQSGVWGSHKHSGYPNKPSAVGLSDASLAMSIGSDGDADF